MKITEDLELLFNILPKSLHEIIYRHPQRDILVEIVLDLGRRAEARFRTHPEYLSPNIITRQDLDYSLKRLTKFSDDNRAGIERTLHRISCIRNRDGFIIGLTCRVGRVICGTTTIIRDLLESKKSILFLGRPGVGKTTIIREISCILANEMQKRVIIVDTSNEIAGDNDVPHFGIGRARRMQVERTDFQHKIMIEAVENHMPEVIIVDEIGTELEALAAQTIAERGVQLIATAHGHFLGSLLKNPTLSNLVGGLQYVTLSDEEAKRRGTQKSIIERKGLATFQLAIELNEIDSWTIYENIENSIDLLLQGSELKLQIRKFDIDNSLQILFVKSVFDNFFIKKKSVVSKNFNLKVNSFKSFSNSFSFLCYDIKSETFLNLNNNWSTISFCIFTYSISSSLIQYYSELLNIPIIFTKNLKTANLIIGLNSHIRNNINLLSYANHYNIPIFLLQKNSSLEIKKILINLLNSSSLIG
jgi:stage III sporulation protein SpoIIIAA